MLEGYFVTMDWIGSEKKPEQVQRSQAWHEWRRKHIGASEVAVIMGVSDFMSVRELWELKTGRSQPFDGNWATKRGEAAESKIRELYERSTGAKTIDPVMEYPEWPVLSASLDAVDWSRGLLAEFKYPSKAKHEMAVNGDVPPTYYPQLQAQMLVSGINIIDYVSYDGESIKIVEVDADRDYQAKMLSACKNFWGYVETDTPPPESTEFSVEILQVKDAELELLVLEYEAQREISQAASERMSSLSKRIKASIGTEPVSIGDFSLSLVTRKGAIDYSAIPELSGVDLDKYRKKDSVALSVKRKGNNDSNH